MQRRKGLSIPKQGESLQHIAPDLRANAVAIAPLILDPKNPRQGDVDLVAGSLRTYKQQKPIVIFKYPDQDRFTVIAGNHTTRGAIQNGWKYIAVTEFRGTPAEAQAFALMDNRSSDVATYNDEALAEVLGKIDLGDSGDLFSLTGYTDDELTYLKSRLDDADFEDEEAEAIKQESETENPLEVVEDSDIEAIVSSGGEGRVFSSTNDLDIPDLLPNMLAPPPDQPMRTWPGERFADLTWPHYWMLVWSWSMKNAPFDRSYLCFYAFDKAFESVWTSPGRFARNFKKNDLKAVVTPNFSMWEHRPLPERLFALYKSRWLGRFYQEVGIKVIPDIIDPGMNQEDLETICFGIPKKPPCVAIQLQTEIKKANKVTNRALRASTRQLIKWLQPESLIVYGSKTGHEVTEKGVFPSQLHVIRLATAQDVKRHKYEPDPLQGKTKSYKRKRRRRPTEEGGDTE